MSTAVRNKPEAKKPVIGVAGLRGSYKKEVVSELYKLAGKAEIEMGDVAERKARERGINVADRSIKEIARKLREKKGASILAEYCISNIERRGVDSFGTIGSRPYALIINGVQEVAEVEKFKKQFGSRFYLLFAKAPETSSQEKSEKKSERQLKEIAEVADYRIKNASTSEELKMRVSKVFEEIKSMVECPLCEKRVPREKLAKHQASNSCVCQRRKKLLKGMKPVPNSTVRDCLREKGVNLVKGVVECESKQRARLGWYAPPEKIEKLEGNTLDPYEFARTAVKACQNEEYIVVKLSPLVAEPAKDPLDEGDLDRAGTLVPFRKDEPGRTRKRKFQVQDGKLYTRKGRRIGERVSNDEVGKELRADMVLETL